MIINLISYNIHKGYTPANGRYVIEPIREMLHYVAPHLALLQEIKAQHPNVNRSAMATNDSQFEYLAETRWQHHAYGQNVHKNGGHGNAILSQYPIEYTHNLDISTNRLESRGLLHTVILLPNQQHLHVLCVHLNLRERCREKQMERICDYIQQEVPQDAPTLMAGDFNDWRKSLCHTLQLKTGLKDTYHALHGEHARTFPSFFPMLSLDRIYFKNLHPILAEVYHHRPWSQLSDHSPILAALDLGSIEAA